jgi:tRNA-splicing ligase RtcB (3'-phosphate/5'-hydroxy nucleic acid ligase)
MILQGKYGKAFVTVDDAEPECISQIYLFLNHPAFTEPIAIMPDTHAGNGAVIGFTMPMTEKVIPNVTGVDIGCGMLSQKIISEVDDLPTLDKVIRRHVPLGFNCHTKPVATMEKDFPWNDATKLAKSFLKKFDDMFNISDTFGGSASENFDKFTYIQYLQDCTMMNISPAQVDSSIGTLGGGNHFIEIGFDENNENWLTIHTGSRNFGLKIATFYQKQAQTNPFAKEYNKDLAYLSYDSNVQYLLHMIFAQHFAALNRKVIGELFSAGTGYYFNDKIESVHNFIDFYDMIIRKGAIRSYKGERMIIPFNMRDGMLICEGKSNPEWNYSAPHGAGRIMSRTQAKKNLSMDDFTLQMKDIYSTCVTQNNLDEAPGAYKDSSYITNAISPTATIVNRIEPLYNLKG